MTTYDRFSNKVERLIQNIPCSFSTLSRQKYGIPVNCFQGKDCEEFCLLGIKLKMSRSRFASLFSHLLRRTKTSPSDGLSTCKNMLKYHYDNGTMMGKTTGYTGTTRKWNWGKTNKVAEPKREEKDTRTKEAIKKRRKN